MEEKLAKMNNNKAKNEKSTPKKNKAKMDDEKKARKKNDPLLQERAQLVLWRKPLRTLQYFLLEIPCLLSDAKNRLYNSMFPPKSKSSESYIGTLIFLFITSAVLTYAGSQYMKIGEISPKLKEDVAWFSYWVFLGILSSVGLGTGLHTFLLYLGPFIAKVTLAAQECGSVQFPRPPYPDQVMCPELKEDYGVTVADIMGKIRWESLMWGFGTALGELPPYFMARAARLSGMEDEELQEFTQLLKQKDKRNAGQLSLLDRGKLWMEDIVEKVGFWGILACASIPNPLFDLAGITCGHFLVPFTTFFGATVIGKAVVKVHLQMMFVILAFNEELLQSVLALIGSIPKVGALISDPFAEFINHQKATFQQGSEGQVPTEGGLLAFALEKLVLGMVIYFVISIINSTAQSHHKRRNTKLKH